MTSTAPNKHPSDWSLWLAKLVMAPRWHPASSDPALPRATTRFARVALSRTARVATLAGVVAAGLVAATRPPRTAVAGDASRSSAARQPSTTGDTLAAAALAQRAVGSLATRALPDQPPATLAQTGLYADWASKTVAADVLAFSPQYPLWSDGATKQRWIYLPSAIDASDADRWQFPVGTRIWKQFSFGTRTETRYMALTASGWTYATYVWNGDVAVRAPRAGTNVRVSATQTHRVPSDADCRACHANAKTPVLGFAPLQLSVDRDPNAPHRELESREGVDLLSLVVGGYVVGLDDIAPRIAGAPIQRAALGYLHGNCGGCHRAEGPLAAVGMELAQSARGDRVIATTAGVTAKFAPQSRLQPGDAEHSLLVARMQARKTLAQMPPIGTDIVDAEALRLVAAWIDQLAPTH